MVGAAIGITLGNLVVPSAEDRIASGTYFITTHGAETPSAYPTPTTDPSERGVAGPEEPTAAPSEAPGTDTGGRGAPPENDDDAGRDDSEADDFGVPEDQDDSGDEDRTREQDDDDSDEPAGPTREPDQPGSSDPPDEPDEPGETAPLFTASPPVSTPSPTPTDPPRDQLCLDLNLSLIELLLCLGGG